MTGAGPSRSLIALAKYQTRLGLPYRHRALVLKRAAYPPTLVEAKRAGIEIMREPDAATWRREIESADIVQIHFWNTPELYGALQNEFPPARILLWCKVRGDNPPQMLPAPVAAFADAIVVTGDPTRAPGMEQARVIHGIADVERLGELAPRPHEHFNVGYIGTVNFNKLHPNFVAMSAAVEVPDIRFVVCGGGEREIAAQAEALGAREKFELRGFVEDIASVLGTLDVFGYPLAPGNYATVDLALQEAMLAGVPPVVLAHGGAGEIVQHAETGLVVHTEGEYKQALELLYASPGERKRLGQNARAFAEAHFGGARAASEFAEVYDEMMRLPKSPRRALHENLSPAELFVASLGDAAPEFGASLREANDDAEQAIARALPALAMGEGGIFHYRNEFSHDPFLRFWTGLVLKEQGRVAQAAGEFRAARELGLDGARVGKYL